MNTLPLADNARRPWSSVDQIADDVEVLEPGDGLSIRTDYGPSVVRELERRGHRVERHLISNESGEPRLLVRIDRPPA